ncbi:aminoethylphosphonate--pyruvate transaminase [Seminavis robusta]|uniref:2-aminoethylphosphonate--pyruvate transaminase n=1 Tax=Seminavis robusta TaxID=568900 RepID=A0A9N8DJ98_9STRA|nr:aminoethylphosphonate--pyruvate transaminase [Seminavis robusta]|eukprot:Sro172_g076050.1 aminoethylphosphonate--pyruvate transaminase (803) ;mRNA; f:69655-72178
MAGTGSDGTTAVCPKQLFDFLRQDLDVDFFTGVPDSCIKHFCTEIDIGCSSSDNNSSSGAIHAIAANEGASIALAIGNYLATNKVPVVYMQNSGLGNATNPILSAAHPHVYGIPMMLILGWRGAPGHADEPQHVVTGQKTQQLCDAMDVPTFILTTDAKAAQATLQEAHEAARARQGPVAVLVPPNTFSKPISSNTKQEEEDRPSTLMIREHALAQILQAVGPTDAVVSTTGFTSRELYELREASGSSHASDFRCVGSMGHAAAIAQGIALSQPHRTVWCLDGDGAALMHLGSMAFSASFGLDNLRHVLINNEVHESVGGQNTVASQGSQQKQSLHSFPAVASSLGYHSIGTATSETELHDKLEKLKGPSGRPLFLEVKVAVGARTDLGRPKTTTEAARKAFMKFCQLPTTDKESRATISSSGGFTQSGEPLLLTPGPLTTSPTVKAAMMHDLGSRDDAFIRLTQKVRQQLVDVVVGGKKRNHEGDLTAVLLQGSGTFAVEAMIGQFVPDTIDGGKLLILCNGAYGRRMGSICEALGRDYIFAESPESEPMNLELVQKALDKLTDVTHVAVVSCETTTGVWNPVEEIAYLVMAKGKRLLIDAMSSFAVVDIPASVPFDAMAASSNKGLQGSPGLGFVLARKVALEESKGNSQSLALDLYSQWQGFEASGEWRFTPPTHCLLALAQALEEFEAEGGVSGRRKRYEANCKTLIDGMKELGFESVVPAASQTPIIVTFRMPTHPNFDFRAFYDRLSSHGYVIYPGKLTAEPTFRVGCIGHMFPHDMEGFLATLRQVLDTMDVSLR